MLLLHHDAHLFFFIVLPAPNASLVDYMFFDLNSFHTFFVITFVMINIDEPLMCHKVHSD